jgi:FlaA1/EpsC-like NDP-sugar epimerase
MTSSSDFNESFLGLEAARDAKPTLRLYRVLQIGALAMIITADLFSLLSSIWLARFVANWLNLERVGMDTISLGMILPAFGGVFALLGLYRLRGANQVDELRLLTWTTTILFAILATFYVLMDDIDATLWFFAFTWVVSVVLFPLSRWVVRGLGARTGFWGEPVVVIGNGSLSSTLVKY